MSYSVSDSRGRNNFKKGVTICHCNSLTDEMLSSIIRFAEYRRWIADAILIVLVDKRERETRLSILRTGFLRILPNTKSKFLMQF